MIYSTPYHARHIYKLIINYCILQMYGQQFINQSRIELIVEVTRVTSEFSFDYLILLLSASVLAAMGLATGEGVNDAYDNYFFLIYA